MMAKTIPIIHPVSQPASVPWGSCGRKIEIIFNSFQNGNSSTSNIIIHNIPNMAWSENFYFTFTMFICFLLGWGGWQGKLHVCVLAVCMLGTVHWRTNASSWSGNSIVSYLIPAILFTTLPSLEKTAPKIVSWGQSQAAYCRLII